MIDDNCSIRYGYRFATLAKVLDVYLFLNQSGYMASPFKGPSKPCTMALNMQPTLNQSMASLFFKSFNIISWLRAQPNILDWTPKEMPELNNLFYLHIIH